MHLFLNHGNLNVVKLKMDKLFIINGEEGGGKDGSPCVGLASKEEGL
jgi:hypothetical protein